MRQRIAIVGDCWDDTDAQWRQPFVGPAGEELSRILADAGLDRKECFLTNVLNLHPGSPDLSQLCCSKSSGDALEGWPALSAGKYLKREYGRELDRLFRELESLRPNIVIALGPVASWALLKSTAIGKIRGAVALSSVVEGLKVIPCHHPATVRKQYDLRPVTVLDFRKALRESAYPELRKVVREFWLDPTLADIESFYHSHWVDSRYGSFDIETAAGQITCIGFAPTTDRCLVVPFMDYRQASGSYWPDLPSELQAWKWVARYLGTETPKVGQNGKFDIQYLWQVYGIPVNNYAHDCMLLHHALQPESPKGLGFLGSVYTAEPAWKLARPKGEHNLKREDDA